jgi:hypothetical protein
MSPIVRGQIKTKQTFYVFGIIGTKYAIFGDIRVPDSVVQTLAGQLLTPSPAT